MSWNQFIGITVLIYALTNPVGAIPIFLGLTRKAGSVKTHRIIILACSAVAIFFVGSALLGKEILDFFNVGLDDFRIAGGLLALFIAFEMFQAQYGKFVQPTHNAVYAFSLSAACWACRTEHHHYVIERFLGKTGINLMTRAMALIVAAMV
jgi:small neutral amino acid transporter SnatA (MarC family)